MKGFVLSEEFNLKGRRFELITNALYGLEPRLKESVPHSHFKRVFGVFDDPVRFEPPMFSPCDRILSSEQIRDYVGGVFTEVFEKEILQFFEIRFAHRSPLPAALHSAKVINQEDRPAIGPDMLIDSTAN